MNKISRLKIIEKSFRKQVKKDKKIKNGYLLIHSDQDDIHMNIAQGYTGDVKAHHTQGNYMASVGKLFTSVLVAMLYEKGHLSFDDKISKFLDDDLMRELHVYQGKDYSNDIKIVHLLKQTSGLPDNFWDLLDELIKDPKKKLSTKQAIMWAKKHKSPSFPPGQGFQYTDMNYHLLGLIVEKVSGLAFHEALKIYILNPLEMNQTYMHHLSEPSQDIKLPMADFYMDGKKLNNVESYANLDYSGGGIVAPLEDLLIFMKALVSHKLIKEETLKRMKSDTSRFALGIDYGYGIWEIKTVPFLMPEKLNCWGVSGATGSFMFYHPKKDAYIIGNFNDFSYKSKGLRFMLLKVIHQLAKIK